MSLSPTQLTLRELRKRGYITAVVEKWNPHAKIRQDLFGFIDVLGVGNGETVAVQCTSYSHTSDRVKKITNHENVPEVRNSNWKIFVHGWRKVKNRWVLREVDVS